MKTLRRSVIVVLIGAVAGCGSDSGTATSPGTPDVTGIWTGLLGAPGSGSALRLTWAASQSGTSVSGPLTIVKPMSAVEAAGPLSGTISGGQLSLSYAVTAGSVAGFPSCSIAGTGSGVLSGSTITGTLMLTFTSCSGASSGLEPPASSQFSLTKQ